MSGRGKAMMGSAVASGDNRATEAVEKALSSPLLDNMHLKNATGVLCNITAGADLKQSEFNLIGQKVKEIATKMQLRLSVVLKKMRMLESYE